MQDKAVNYYEKVGAYYDQDAPEFEARYWKNPVLQRIRADFRTFVHKEKFATVLEIGFGSGLDLAHFAMSHPEAMCYGIDVSQQMVNLANEKKTHYNLPNIQVAQGSVEDVVRLFPGVKFDMIYVFFGALNTVKDLSLAADALGQLLDKEGKMVLTFVNKWYLQGTIIELLKLRPRAAFSRFFKVWGGYSPSRYLESVCYSYREIRQHFKNYSLESYRGYSIMHPAWYYIRFNILLKNKGRWLLWNTDLWLNRTPARKWGEYALYVFSHKNG
ncbi:methyltransferase domain-containing protein [bacterium]|nr:methyltransferase domain-containing protein [bacterium]